MNTHVPIPVRVTRYRCPWCSRPHSARSRCVEHIGRCWSNPAVRGCKTCANHRPYQPAGCAEEHPGWCAPEVSEYCTAGIDLTGRPACPACDGEGWADTPSGGQRKCGPHLTDRHIGDGSEVKPGPIVGCPQWTPTSGEEAS